MKVNDLLKHLQQMQTNGKGEYDIVHVNGNGAEKALCGFEVVESSIYLDDKKSGFDKAEIEKPNRLRLLTHSPF